MRRIMLIAALVPLVAPTPSSAALLSPNQAVNGLSQAELSGRWWQWAASYPNDANPVQDTTGAFSHLGADQTAVAHPGIFFLAGSFSQAPVARSVTIGPGQFLFFPLTNVVSASPFNGSTEAALRQDAADDLGVVSNLTLTLNGSPVPLPSQTTSLLEYQQLSPPGLFDLNLPVNNVFGAPAGNYPAVSTGYWVALEPLAAGSYELRFTSRSVGTGAYAGDVFTQDVTYNVTVVPEPAGWTMIACGVVGVSALARKRSRRG